MVTYATLPVSKRVVTRGPKEDLESFQERVEYLRHRELRGLK